MVLWCVRATNDPLALAASFSCSLAHLSSLRRYYGILKRCGLFLVVVIKGMNYNHNCPCE